MANGTSISELKEKIVHAIAEDDTLFFAIDAHECENGGDLIGTHIFKFNKNIANITIIISTNITI